MSYVAPNVPSSGAVLSQLVGGGASGLLNLIVTGMATTSAPVTAPTVSAAGNSTSGGLLAAGGYLCEFTETNGVGETTISPQSAAMTVATAGIPLITFPALQTGNTARNLYITPANGASGTEVLYVTGVTATTVALGTAATTTSDIIAPPTTNSTGLSYTDANGVVIPTTANFLKAAKNGHLDEPYKQLASALDDYSRGDPVSITEILRKIRQAHTAFLAMAKVCNDAGVLIADNPGYIRKTTQGPGMITKVRAWT